MSEISKGLNEMIRGSIGLSPFGVQLGVQVERVVPDEVVVKLPYSERLTTVGDIVHGGAIASLIDIAATAAAWSGAKIEDNPRGTTVALTVNYLSAARGQDLTAVARVVRRGRAITVCEVKVDQRDSQVAQALVTYKLGT